MKAKYNRAQLRLFLHSPQQTINKNSSINLIKRLRPIKILSWSLRRKIPLPPWGKCRLQSQQQSLKVHSNWKRLPSFNTGWKVINLLKEIILQGRMLFLRKPFHKTFYYHQIIITNDLDNPYMTRMESKCS